jgi:hypothetical protein
MIDETTQTPLHEDGTVDYETLTDTIVRVARSFLYFVLNFCWIENKTESGERLGESKFNLWPMQRPLCAMFVKFRLFALLKARQLGITWLVAAYALWRCITKRGFLVVIISAKQEWASEVMDRIKFIHNRLPRYLQRELSRESQEHMRLVWEWDEEGKNPIVYSDIKSLTTKPEGAQSKTPDLLILDETARSQYASEIYGASKPGIDKAGGQIIIISNPHKRGPGWAWTRRICSAAYKGTSNIKFLFLPWWACPERLTPEEAAKLEADLSFVPSHFKKLQEREGVDVEDISENYPDTPEEALATASGSYFGDTLTRHSAFTTPGLHGTIYRDKRSNELFFQEKDMPDRADGEQIVERGPYIFTLWRYPYFLTSGWNGEYWANRYAMGSDVSEGQGRSYSVAYVIDRLIDEFVCRIRSNRVDAVDWAKYLNTLSEYYANYHYGDTLHSIRRERAMICVERTGAGLTTVKELEKVGANQYVRQLYGKRGDSTTDMIGWHEDQQAKHLLCGDLKNWYRTCRGHVYDATLLDESSTTIEHEDGRRIGPEKGEERDCVVAAGCTVQASLQLGGPPEVLRRDENVSRQASVSNWGR